MSWLTDNDPIPGDAQSCDAIEDVIIPRARDLGGFEVRRALPSAKRQMVGPFIFFDQMGPAQFLSGQGIDVRPHPHIGLATVTYLFDGEMMHRDSLGSALCDPARRSQPDDRRARHRAFGAHGAGIAHGRAEIFSAFNRGWRLPKSHEEDAPTFAHHAVADLPRFEGEGKRVRLIIGSLFGKTSPAAFPHDCFYAEAVLAPGAVLPLDPDYDERAVLYRIGPHRYRGADV